MFLKLSILIAAFSFSTIELTVEQVLDKVEAVNMTSVTSDVTYIKTDSILGRKEIRTGRLLYRTCLADHKEVVIAFDTLIIGKRRESKQKQYIFSGRWLVERDPEKKQFIKRELVSKEEEKSIDPFELGNGPIPLPIAQSKDSVLKQFNVTMTPLPNDGPLSRLEKNTVGLLLTPKNKSEWVTISLFYNPDTWLPIGVHTVEEDGTTRTSHLKNTLMNELQDEEVEMFNIDSPDPKEWSIDIQPYSN